jgi:acyl carrier protein
VNGIVIERQIAEVICRIAGISTLQPDQDYFDAGLASVQALELLLELESVFGIALSDEDFAKARTSHELGELVGSLVRET